MENADGAPRLLQSSPSLLCDSVRDALIDGIASEGFAVATHAIPLVLVAALRTEALRRDALGVVQPGVVGRADSATLASDIRDVRTSWLDGSSPAENEILRLLDGLRLALNRQLLLGLFELEAQFLVYGVGGFYTRHLDSFAGARNRVLSLVVYLNEDWAEGDGGHLLIWPANSDPDAVAVARISPEGGTVVLMLSEEIPHQVEPAGRTRVAIAGWWRVNQSSGGRVDPPA